MKLDKELIKNHQNIMINFIDKNISIENYELSNIIRSIRNEHYDKKLSTNEDLKKLYFALDAITHNNTNDINDEKIKFLINGIKFDSSENKFKTDDPYIESLFLQKNLLDESIDKSKHDHISLTLTNICANFELLISKLMKFELLNIYKHGAYISNNQIKYSDIEKLGSIREVKKYFIEEYVQKAQYKDTLGWCEDFIKICTNIKINGSDSYKKNKNLFRMLNLVAETFLLRNIYVHNDGIVNDKFLSGISKLSLDTTNTDYYKQRKDKRIQLSIKDLSKTINNINYLSSILLCENIKKNKLFNDINYKRSLTDNIFKKLEDNPTFCRTIFEEMVNVDLKLINNKSNNISINSLNVDLSNLWLSYYLNGEKEQFLKNHKKAFIKIKEISGSNRYFKLLNTFVETNSKEVLIKASKEFISSFKNKKAKINALAFPMFSEIRNEDDFIAYAMEIKYNKHS